MSKGFVNYQSTKKKKLPTSWRKARGLHNKVRREIHGKPARVKIGYGTPRLKPAVIVIATAKDVVALQARKEKTAVIVQIASTVGMKKKIQLSLACTKAGFTVENLAKDYVEKAQSKFTARVGARAQEKKAKLEKQEKASKKAAEKDAKAQAEKAKTDSSTAASQEKADEINDEKKEKEKQEKDKVLITKK